MGTFEPISFSDRVTASVVIPHFSRSREENVRNLIGDLRQQTFKEIEVIVVPGVSPQGKAINTGAKQARGEILIVADDDSRLGHERVIENLVRVIRENPGVAMAGASILTPETANRFQKAAAKEFPRLNMPVVEEVTETDLACHGCVAFRKDVFIQVGMERENILRGLDPDLRVRIRKAGYRVVLAPDTWAYHPFPENLLKFIRLFFRNGSGSAYIQVFHPELVYDTDEALHSEKFVARRPLIYRALRFPLRLLKALVTLQWLRLLGYTVYLAGYIAGFVRFRLFSPPPSIHRR